MNKTLSINLNSLVFQIDEIAYEKLSNYLKAIANRFEGMEGADEITSDIEARIAEMFSEKLSNTKQVISLADVEAVIEVMGRPEDFETIEDELEAEPAPTKGKKYPRKLFRDTENSIVGGVCSGISAYLGISDPIFLRLIFLIAFFGFGSGFLLYIILWIVIPEAKTASDKLHMRGEAINVSNIEKTIKEEFDNIKKNIDGNQSANKITGLAKELVSNILNVLYVLLKAILKIAGLLFVIIGSIALTALLVVPLVFLFSGDASLMTFSDFYFENSIHKYWSYITILTLVLIPLLTLIYLGLRFLGGRRFRIPVFSKSMILVFFITLISIIALSAYTATCFSSSSSGSKKVMLQLPESQRIHLEGQKIAPAGKPVVYFFNRDEYIVDEDMLWLGDKVKLDVLQSPDETAFLEIITKAKGSSRGQAFDRQESIQFNISMQDSVLRIPAHFPIEDPEKLRGQEVQLHLRLPLGAQVYLAESSKSVIYDIKNVTNTYDGNMIGYTWEMRPAGLTCIDCNGVALNRQQNFSMEELILNEDFTEVEANGAFDIHISEGPFLLQSDGENEIEYSVKNNRLQIENKKRSGFFDRQTKINLQMPELSELELNSVADASIKGFENSKMDMRISGANNCRIDIQAEELNLEINGAAKVNLEGESEKLYLEINGASKLDGTAFRTENAKVKIAGASKVDVWVTDKLDAKVSGASSLNYKGLPEIVSDVSGFSSIKPIQ